MQNHWVLIDDSYEHFDIWRHITKSGEPYNECFPKGEDPNVLYMEEHEQFMLNPYKFAMNQQGILYKEMAGYLGMSGNMFNARLNGEVYFRKHDLEILNAYLGYSSYGNKDLRVIVNPKYWRTKKTGVNESEGDNVE